MAHKPFFEERFPEHEVLFTSENLPGSLSSVVRERLSIFLPTLADRIAQEKVRTALRTIQMELAARIKSECAGTVQFCAGAMINPDETTPDDCAQRLLETIPLYHILVGSSFYLSTLRDRRKMLERLNLPNIRTWQERASYMVEDVLDQLLPEENSNKKPRSRRNGKQ